MKPEEVLEYAQVVGPHYGANLVLLLGPDNIEGGLDAYENLLKILEMEETSK